MCGVGKRLVLTYLRKGIYMKNPYQQVGNRIRIIRRQKGLTQAQLAEKSDLSDNFIGLIERGEGHPTIPTISKIADALGVKLNEFFADDEESSKNVHQVIKELEHLLKERELKDVQLLLSLGKKIFEVYPNKK